MNSASQRGTRPESTANMTDTRNRAQGVVLDAENYPSVRVNRAGRSPLARAISRARLVGDYLVPPTRHTQLGQ